MAEGAAEAAVGRIAIEYGSDLSFAGADIQAFGGLGGVYPGKGNNVSVPPVVSNGT